MHNKQDDLTQSELGKKSAYKAQYDASLLFPIPRKHKRDEINVPDVLPFRGVDVWNHYEVSWLNGKGKPVVALAEMIYGCDTPNIIESKSMKLYFNSFNNSRFENADIVRQHIEADLSERVGGRVEVRLFTLPLAKNEILHAHFNGICLDVQDVACDQYTIDAGLLSVSSETVEEVLYSDLLKSNCLVTYQPDWGSVQITYKGRKIDHTGLLQYIVSFRNHNEFHEQCIERIFMDIMARCQPEELTVMGRYTRRGGIDINPMRTNRKNVALENLRLCRQ